MNLSEQQLNSLNKEALIILVASLQTQLNAVQGQLDATNSQLDKANEQLAQNNKQIELLAEQIRLMNQRHFGRKSENDIIDGQMSIFDFFNEAEATATPDAPRRQDKCHRYTGSYPR